MSNDPSRVELVLHHDHRLLAAVGAVVEFAGERAGLSVGAQQALSHATAEACEEAFSLAGRNGNPDPVVKVAVSDFPDRVEVAIEHVGESCVNRPRPNVDRVECEAHEGKSRTTLVKYCAASKSERKA
jgi:anti-sigma regulatory factor (Ser/Thr protein kinase)